MKRWLQAVVLIIFAVTFALNIFTAEGSHENLGAWWHKVPGVYIIIGLIGCIILILVSKWLGIRFLQRDDQYYEKGD